jgi:hypothetical protein
MYSDSLQTNPQTGSVGASRVVRVAILSGLFVCSLLGFGTETACGATFRVDDSSLTVPAILSDDWQTVKLRKTWARADGKKKLVMNRNFLDFSRATTALQLADQHFESRQPGLRRASASQLTNWLVL